MIRIFFLVSFSLLLVLPVKAMAEEEPPAASPTSPTPTTMLEVGLQGQLNLSNVVFQDVDNLFTVRLGLGGGLQGSLRVHDRFTLQLEALYSQRGMTGSLINIDVIREDDEESPTFTGEAQTFNFHQIQSPLLGIFVLPLGERFSLTALAGPYLSVLLGRTRTSREGTFQTTDDGLSSFIFGGMVGAGLDTRLERGTLNLSLRYERDFTSFLETEDADSGGAYHWSGTLVVGYRVALF